MSTVLSSPLQPFHVDLAPVAKKTALVVIDMQPPYFQDSVLASKKNDLVQQCNELIELFQSQSHPVFLVRTVHSADEQTWTLKMKQFGKGFATAGEEDTIFVEGLDFNRQSVTIINKTRDSAFIATDLEVQLRSQGISTLVICGVSTHSCVGLTAADAYARNFFVLLASDAIASHKPKYHSTVLAMLGEEYSQPVVANQQVQTFLKTEKLPSSV